MNGYVEGLRDAVVAWAYCAPVVADGGSGYRVIKLGLPQLALYYDEQTGRLAFVAPSLGGSVVAGCRPDRGYLDCTGTGLACP